ncbi:acyltransferase [Butyrivibrio sp. JL13D10]|uniref:acyltransferase n=1 Tax=Butyrivibrio sp. JL13D10 TaxID=3236815 RepID=UPI0038B4F7C0
MERENNYDLLRLLSTLAVILLHVNAQYYMQRSNYPKLEVVYIVESSLNIITRFCVPCFAMISGAFLLNGSRLLDILGFYKQSFRKLCIPTIIYSIVLLVRDIRIQFISGGNLVIPFDGLLRGAFYNYWYMYMLIGLYLIAPLIQIIKNNTSKKAFSIMTIIMLVWACISQYYSSYRSAYSMGIVFAYCSYFMLGNILYERAHSLIPLKGVKLRWSAIRSLFIILFIYIVVFYIRYRGFRYYEFDAYSNFFSPLIMVYSVVVFWFFSRISINIKIDFLSRYSFLVYLSHTIVYIELFQWLKECLPHNEILSIIVVTVLTIVVSFIVAISFYKLINRLYARKR